MAQHDYIISNQTFPNTRADINNLASAIATNNSGTSAPTTQYAGQWWIDTTSTTWTLYIHDGTDDIQFATIDTSANTVNFTDSALDVVTDTTPQLGGNLDLNSNDITGTGNINITGTVTATSFSGDGSSLTGITSVGGATGVDFNDNVKARFGTGNDLEIYHDGTNSYISDQGTGKLKIFATDLEINNAGNTANYIEAFDGGAVKLYHNNALKLETTSTGATVTGTLSTTDSVSSTNGITFVGNSGTPSAGAFLHRPSANTLVLGTASTERMRIDSSGNVLVGTTSFPSASVTGLGLQGTSNYVYFARSGAGVLNVDRHTNDGTIVDIRQDGTAEGTISVSGATVAYNGFTGTHWSRLSDNSKPTILKGTILESLDEMMDWYQVQFDITETDDEGKETTRTEKQIYALGNSESVGDVITYDYNTGKQDDDGNDIIEQVQATIIQEADVKHTKAKISDTVDAKNVYGVFMDWDNDDDTVNDMYVAQTGTFVVRLNSSVTTLNKGDLIQSNGDGTGKVQADDLLRASTVAKVLSITKIETYEDGSYIVPCSLHC